MSVPEEIRKVPRPKNTVVCVNGNGINKYVVRQRAGAICKPGRNPMPLNGIVVGHIIDMKFVPVVRKTAEHGPDMLSFGAAAFAESVSEDLLDDLLEVYSPTEAYTIMAIASLRAIKPHICNGRLNSRYKTTFVSVYYNDASMSANSVSRLLEKIGMDGEKRKEFFQKRSARIEKDHHIVIDGMLKKNTSTVNDLSAFSRKARERGREEISVLYAFDLDAMEIICGEVFPGNEADSTAYPAFIKDNNLNRGLIINDKGFPPSSIEAQLKARPDLHFLTPIKRNDSRIKNNNMLEFTGILENIEKRVLYKKQQIKGGRWLYAFMDAGAAGKEESDYIDRARKKNDFSIEDYSKKENMFGVIVLESDMDMDPRVAYLSYHARWQIELVFDFYKNTEQLDQTCVQNDYSVIGNEFVNTITSIITNRMIQKAEKAGLLKENTYGEILDDLNESWRMKSAPPEAHTEDEFWVHTLVQTFGTLEALGLSIPEEKPEPKKRGRPRKNPPLEDKPKRPRGRPPKRLKNPNVDKPSGGETSYSP